MLDAMPRKHARGEHSGGPVSSAALIRHVGFNVNWQWPAINMQYERLMARARLAPERMLYEHMNTVADMDFW
jgi:hypothetical protein